MNTPPARGESRLLDAGRARSRQEGRPERCCFRGRVPLATAILVASTVMASAQSTNLLAAGPPLPDVSFSVFRVLGALVLVLALFLGGVWLFKNWQRLAWRKGGEPKLKILEARSLGNRHALYVVAYEEQRLMLAASPTGVTFISHLPSGPGGEVAPLAADFSETLQVALNRKA